MSKESKDTYCVYVHTDINGNIFYIGSGRLERALFKELSKHKGRGSRRGTAYSDKVAELNYNYTVKIVENNLSKDEALSLERILYDKLIEQNVDLTNNKRPSKVKIINLEDIEPFVYYDTSSPSCLRWKTDCVITGQRKPHTEAGSLMGRGCYQVKINNTNYLVHRIVAVLHGYNITGLVVDHINGIPSDNRIENLKICTDAENSRNRKIQCNNTSGLSGVNFNKSKNIWVALLRLPFSKKGKEFSFSVSKYGYNGAKQLAIEARIKMLEDARNNGIKYSDRHGKPDESVLE